MTTPIDTKAMREVSTASSDMPDEKSDLLWRCADKVIKTARNGCWTWNASKQSNGYGQVWFRGRLWPAHRALYTVLIGEVPQHLVLDHLCENKLCVRPTHLRVCTERENILRGTGISAINSRKERCRRGHPLSGDNLLPLTEKQPHRRCKTCKHENDLKARLRDADLARARHSMHYFIRQHPSLAADMHAAVQRINREEMNAPEAVKISEAIHRVRKSRHLRPRALSPLQTWQRLARGEG